MYLYIFGGADSFKKGAFRSVVDVVLKKIWSVLTVFLIRFGFRDYHYLYMQIYISPKIINTVLYNVVVG